MRYLKITNNGEIDTKAFELIGASTKVGDTSKIGMFGSGLNYSLAFLIKNNIDFKIYSGEKEIKITTEVTEFRGKAFERIIINGKETSFTTDMGLKWKPWFVIREIYSNAIDEGGETMEETSDIVPEKGKTTYFIQVNESMQEVLDNWELYFTEKRKDLLYEANKDDLFPGIKVFTGGRDFVVYRKGIRVLYKKDEQCCFHYDIPDVDINESRLIDNEYGLGLQIVDFWYRQASSDLIKELHKKINNTFEGRLDWEGYGYKLSDNWDKALENRFVVEKEFEGHYGEMSIANNPIVLPQQLAKSVISKYGLEKHVAGKEGGKGIKKLEASSKEKFMLKKVEEFCKECEYETKYPINIVQFTKKGILGLASEGEIYLAREAFDSFELLIKTVIEENEHLETGFDDNSRPFQDHFINMFFQEKLKRFAYTI